VLNLTEYAKIEEPSFRSLMLEFFSSFVLVDGNEFFTCRLKGREYTVDDDVMKKVCVDPEPYNFHDAIYHEDKTTMRCINFAELKNADLIKTRTTVQPYTSRHAYKTYFTRLGQSAPTTDQPGSSRQPTETDEHERMLVDDDHLLPAPP
ncbi:cell division control protein 42 homolog, partial [Striga asiatica]